MDTYPVHILALAILCSTAPHSAVGSDSPMTDPIDLSPCSAPKAPLNGLIDCTSDGTKTTCTAKCKLGYKFVEDDSGFEGDSRVFICDESTDSWEVEPVQFQCQEIMCFADEPVNGLSDCMVTGTMKLCSIKCSEGFRTVHAHMFMCDMETNEWSPKLPTEKRFPECIFGEKECINMESPTNGRIICDVKDSKHICTPYCDPGFVLDVIEPGEYFTCGGGEWTPNIKPKCLETTDPVDPDGYAAVTAIYTMGDIPVEQTGYCMAWGQHHYRTFDGKIFRFQGECTYTLFEDTDHLISVTVSNEKGCKGMDCRRTVSMFIGDLVLELKGDPENGDPAVFADDEQVTLPASMTGILLQRVADFIVIRDPQSDFYLKWDGREAVHIRVGEDYKDRTQGLCGSYNEDHKDDFKKPDGNLVENVATFATSWASGTCVSSTPTYCSKASDAERKVLAKALQGCKFILETSCKYVVNPVPYFESCKEDVCFSGDDDSVCSSMASYFRECSRFGVIVEWRNEGRCAMSCPDKQCYDVCGSSCPKTCYDTSYNCENDHCIEGCHCPDGTYLHNGTCVTRKECPCQYARKEYAPGSRIRRDCNRCLCTSGKWVCTKNTCDSVCKAVGDHFTTFDGKHFDFDGKCSYTLVQTDGMQDIAFEVKLIKTCSAQDCDRSLSVTVNGEEAKILHTGIAEIKGEERLLPYHNYFYAIEKVTTKFYKVTINSGLTILFDAKDRIYVRAQPTLCNKLRGMCGNFNGQTTDDFWTKKGDLAANANDFGDEWVTGTCLFPTTAMTLTSPCDVHKAFKARARDACNRLTSSPFTDCHEVVNYRQYYENCMADICGSEDTKAQCRSISDYAIACSKLGVIIEEWRNGIEECADETMCESGTTFRECANACGVSCGSLQTSELCSEQCVPGCTCPTGMVFDYNGNCVSIVECTCIYKELLYDPGETRMQDCNVCECHNGKWACTDNDCPVKLSCMDNQEFTSCLDPDVRTCLNMHLPTINRKIEKCLAGCQCVDGYVWDDASAACITPTSCPCYHGGRSYGEEETMQQDCNICRCTGGVWTCGTDECAGLCRAYGDSHYTTFDNARYQFSGSNEFTFVRSTTDNPHSFKISIENVVCGTKGNTCSKRVVFSVNTGDAKKENFVELVRGKAVQERRIGSFEITYVGLWVFVKAKDMGVTLQWDKTTSIIVRVDAMHKGKVEGLCGDFDGLETNDFKTPQNSIEVNEITFVNSWKTYLTGSDAVSTPTDICADNKHRKYWAERKCAILTGSVFSPCHALVPPLEYYDACVYDACGCDMGGDCECVCTAIHAYAQECNRFGVHIYWRSQSVCPLMCYGKGREYEPCLSACPKTCSNYNEYEKVAKACDFACVEGCSCPDGTVTSSDGQVCEALDTCVCDVIDGVSYTDGEKIESMSDDCRSCYCMDKAVHCLGFPCDEGGTPLSGESDELAGGMADIGAFDYKPAELTPALCEDLYDNFVETCGKDNVQTCSHTCEDLCHSYRAVSFQCAHADADGCVDTCGDDFTKCSSGQALRDAKTCIKASECPCAIADGSTIAPGQVRSDYKVCIRYHCWNNILSEEILAGCVPMGFSAKLGSSSVASAHAGPGYGYGGGAAAGARSDTGLSLFTGPTQISFDFGRSGDSGVAADVAVDNLQDVKASAKVDNAQSVIVDVTKEDNGAVINHVTAEFGTMLLGVSSNLNAHAGYTAAEQDAIGSGGALAIADGIGTAMFHDAGLVVDIQCDDGGDAKVDVNVDSKTKVDASAAVDGAAALRAAIVAEDACCIDETGIERQYGESWVYARDACDTCTCHDAGSVRCVKKACDPYPLCPEGYYVVEEITDGCCHTYRIVKDDCDISQCNSVIPECAIYEEVVATPITGDECCSDYECVCNPSHCPTLGDPACPDGCKRVVVDSDTCCPIAKCVNVAKASATAKSSILGMLGGSLFSFAIPDTGDKKETEVEVAVDNKVDVEANAVVDSAIDLDVAADARDRGFDTLVGFSTGLTSTDLSSLSGADAFASGSGLGPYLGAKADSTAFTGLNLDIGGTSLLFSHDAGGHGSADVNVDVGSSVDAGASTDVEQALSIDIASESSLCVDDEGKERCFGDSWTKNGDACMICSCVDTNQVQCSERVCDDPPVYIPDGKKVIEEDVDGCCKEYRLIPDTCDESSCPYSPLTCGMYETCVSYSLDECCFTYECACDEQKCPVLGNPPCPEGCKRTVLDQDQCCPVGKCIYINKAAAESGASLHAMFNRGGIFASLVQSDGHGSGLDVDVGVDTAVKADASAATSSDIGVDVSADTGKKGGQTAVISFAPGHALMNLGSVAYAGAASNAPQYPFYGSAKADAHSGLGLNVQQGDIMFSLGNILDRDEIGIEADIKSATKADAAAKTDVNTDIVVEIVSEADACIDVNGVGRYFGECWTDDKDLCLEYICRDVGEIIEREISCDEPPVPGPGEKLVEKATGGCCKSYSIVSTECDETQCQYQPLLCGSYEKLMSYKLDECCSTYECACDSSKCPSLGSPPCPDGCTRRIIERESCCPVGKCVRTGAIATAQSSLGLSALFGPHHLTIDRGYGSGNSIDVLADINNKANINALAGADLGIDIEVLAEKSMCTGEDGTERSYGECWYKNGDACNICTCYSTNEVRCNEKICDPYPATPEGYMVVKEKADDCCYAFRIVADDCDVSKCTDMAPICNFYEDLVSYPVDSCCSTYECKCNKNNCADVGEAPCPTGCARMEIESEECCPVKKCVRTLSSADAYAKSALMASVGSSMLSLHYDHDQNDDLAISAEITNKNNINTEAVIDTDTGIDVAAKGDGLSRGGFMGNFNIGGFHALLDNTADAKAIASGLPGYYGGDAKATAQSHTGLGFNMGPIGISFEGEGDEGGDAKVDVILDNDVFATADAIVDTDTGVDVNVKGDGSGSGPFMGNFNIGGFHAQLGNTADAKAIASGLPGYYGGDAKATAQSHTGLGFNMGPIGISFEGQGDEGGDAKVDVILDNDVLATADSNINVGTDVVVQFDGNAVCIDEVGRERKFGETWYFNNDPCTVSACTASCEVSQQTRECDPYPSAPTGYKVVSERADDCCFIHRVIKSDCDPALCENTAPVCEYFEDLNHIPQDSCCASYECSCNPTKCPVLGDAPCPPNSKHMLLDDHSCCPVKKCVKTLGAEATALSRTDAGLFAGGLSAMFEFNRPDGDNLHANVDIDMKSDISANAQAGSDTKLDVAVSSDDGPEGLGSLLFGFGGLNMLASSSAQAQANANSPYNNNMFGAAAHADTSSGVSLLIGDTTLQFESDVGTPGGIKADVSLETDQKAIADASIGTDVSVDVAVDSGDDGPGFNYISFATNKYMLLASNEAKASASFGTEGNCPGVEDVPETPCGNDQYFDGTNCVYAQDCPCMRDGVKRATGSVWRENAGCENCICIGGEVKCTAEVCETTECPAGQTLSYEYEDACCPVCVPTTDSCIDSNNVHREVGEVWIDEEECKECTCTSSGITYSIMDCAEEVAPVCGNNEMLVQKTEGCCPSYECVCDKSTCTSEVPTCDHEYQEAVAINPEECCPTYDCVCRSEKCPPASTCADDEKRVMSNVCTDCCAEYTCQKLGCTDESGTMHSIGETWEHATDSCLTCECTSDQNQICTAKQCKARIMPVCQDGKEPSIVFDVNGCCASYVCDFTCTGYSASARIQTFDGIGYSRSCPCTHVLARDIFGLDFEISVNRKYCSGSSGSVCTDSFMLNNKLASSSILVKKDMEVDGDINGFSIDQVSSKVSITFKNIGVVFEYDHNADAWEIIVPAKFSGTTEGLCGMADGDITNDLWLGGYSIAMAKARAVETFFNHWLVDASAECYTDALASLDASFDLAKDFCTKIFSKAFSSYTVDRTEYLDICARVAAGCDIPEEGSTIRLSWPGCSALSAYAVESSKTGTCQEWRSAELCAYSTCDVEGASYSACGPSVVRTCENYKTYNSMSVTFSTEGCFCSDGQVILDGKCVETTECPVCIDESDVGRKVGEQWRIPDDPCLVGTCQPDGQIVQSQVSCPAAPECEEREQLVTVVDDEECCPVYQCVYGDIETRCAAVTCPAVVRPVCDKVGETLVATPTGEDQCCMTYTCKCNTATCVDVSLTACEEGEELEIVNPDGCCPTATCVCKPDSCPAYYSPSCAQGYVLSEVSSGRCCVEFQCVCDRTTCEDSVVPTCSGGEVAEVTNPGECCPVYECSCIPDRCEPPIQVCGRGFKLVKMSTAEDCCDVYECVCDTTQCPVVSATYCPSTPGFRLVKAEKASLSVDAGECCPSQTEDYCVCDISTCKLAMPTCASYQRVHRTNPDGCCPEYECECDYESCARGEMSCPSNKHLVEKVVNDCCSTTVCECNECAEPQPCKDGYRAIDTTDECGCIVRTLEPEPLCFYDGASHEPGSAWMEDVCNECTCSDTPNSLGEYETTCTITKCGTCSAGYTYIPVAGQCCGDCVPNVCHHSSKQYAVGQTWIPEGDSCKTCECMTDPITNEVYTECTTPSCPEIDPSCPEESIVSDGCCSRCTAEAQTSSGCTPTVDYSEPIEVDGCVSSESVEMTMCHGSCTSGSIFSAETGSFQKQCTCCTAVAIETRTANLTCPDGSTKKHTYQVATQCECQSSQCGAP